MMRQLLVILIRRCTPHQRETWSRAMEAEIISIPSDFAVILFGLGCLVACARFQMENISVPQPFRNVLSGDRFTVTALVAGTITGIIGLTYLILAGAPTNMIMINGLSLIIGLLLAILIRFTFKMKRTSLDLVALISAVILLGTAIFGVGIEGANRWLAIGPYMVQPSLILLPLIIICYHHLSNFWGMLAVALAALAMVLQPDRAMSGMLFLAILVLSYSRPTNSHFAISVVCAVMFVGTMMLPDRLTAVPFVDHILWTAFDIGFLMGVALWIGCLLLLVPIIFLSASQRTTAHWIFVSCWLAVIAAAAMGAYPTPIVGYGASAIIGYFLCLAFVSPVSQKRLDDPKEASRCRKWI